MKKIFVILAALMICAFVHAQKNFQGEIIYRLHAAMGSKPDAELKIFFGDNKLKLLFKEKEEYDDEELIILFDSAARYVVNRDHKTFKKKPLIISTPKKQIEKRSFLGYSTTPLALEGNGLQNILGEFVKTADVVFYLADSLYYAIPAIFEGNQELIAIYKNKIVLAAEIEMKNPFEETADTSAKKADIITAEAIEIKPMKINDDEFSIPADYRDTNMMTGEAVVDTVATIPAMPVDSVVTVNPLKKKTGKKPLKPGKSKTTVKSEALKRKE